MESNLQTKRRRICQQLSAQDRKELVITSLLEAANQGEEGHKAVLNVTLNRMAQQDESRTSFIVCQKSQYDCYNWSEDKINDFISKNEKTYQSIENTLDGIINKELAQENADNTQGSNLYYNPEGVSQTPDFAIKLQRRIKIGDHLFYYDKYLPKRDIDQNKMNKLKKVIERQMNKKQKVPQQMQNQQQSLEPI